MVDVCIYLPDIVKILGVDEFGTWMSQDLQIPLLSIVVKGGCDIGKAQVTPVFCWRGLFLSSQQTRI